MSSKHSQQPGGVQGQPHPQLSPTEVSELQQAGIADPQQFFGNFDKAKIAMLLRILAGLLDNM